MLIRLILELALADSIVNFRFIVKASSGPRYVVTCKQRLDAGKLTTGTRVALDITTLTIMSKSSSDVMRVSLLLRGDAQGGRPACFQHA